LVARKPQRRFLDIPYSLVAAETRAGREGDLGSEDRCILSPKNYGWGTVITLSSAAALRPDEDALDESGECRLMASLPCGSGIGE
jgi:hypothetical protein